MQNIISGVSKITQKTKSIMPKPHKGQAKTFLNYASHQEIFKYIKTYLLEENVGTGEMWMGRALFLLESGLPAICQMRDIKKIECTGEYIHYNLQLGPLIRLHDNTSIDSAHKEKIKKYLNTLPGFCWKKISDVTGENHGYISMILIRFLNDSKFLEKLKPLDKIISDKYKLEKKTPKPVQADKKSSYKI